MGVQLRLLELMGSLERNLKMLAAILLLCVALGSPAEAVQIDVIYESLCPDSTRFISQQIPPCTRPSVSTWRSGSDRTGLPRPRRWTAPTSSNVSMERESAMEILSRHAPCTTPRTGTPWST